MKFIIGLCGLFCSVNCFGQMPNEESWHVPAGWQYVLSIGNPEIFNLYSLAGANDEVMDIYSHNSAAILAKNTVMPLDESTTLEWSWRVDQLPSLVAENTASSHDYISVAVLFDNGQDISYVWSKELSVDEGFRCPLPDWKDRETHVVIRSGEEDLSQWLAESRNLAQDYKQYVGGELPAQVAQVWLITVSMFQEGSAKALVKNIQLQSEDAAINIGVL